MNQRLMRLMAGALLACAVSTASAADVNSAPLRFEIKRFDVRGNTLLPDAAVDDLTRPFTGPQREFADVSRALEALQAAYHARGYQLVRIVLPEQELDQGVIVFNVVQAKIGRVTVRGNQHVDAANVRRSLPGLREGESPDLRAVSKSLKLANENPARQTSLKLQDAAGGHEVDATLDVTDEKPWKTTFGLDNTGTASTGRTRANVMLQHANLFDLDHVLSLQYTTSIEKPSQIGVYGVGYHIPLYALGDSLDFFASYSDVDAGTVTAGIFDISVSGKGHVYGARYNHNLPTVGAYQSKLVYGLDYKAFENSVELLGLQLGNDITVHPVSVAYQGNYAMSAGEAGFGLTLLRNLPGGSNGGQRDFTANRSGAKDDYAILRLSASLTHALPSDWQARMIVNGQYTADALVPGEQFGVGGAASVRGFDEREVANDNGVSANLELYTPPLCRDSNWQCRMLAFYDGAHVSRNHALPGELRGTTIASAGVGVRLQYGRDVSVQMDYGHVLQAGATGRANDDRLHVRVGLSF